MTHTIKWLVRCLYLPFFLILGNGTAIYLIEHGHNKFSLIAVVGFFILLSFLVEKWMPFDAAFNQPQGDSGRDVIHAIVNECLNIIGIVSVPFFASLLPIASIWPVDFPLWVQLLIAILIADVGITLAHFASHRINLLWQLHAVHHSVKRLYGFNGLMKHPLHQIIETLVGASPLILIGIPQEVMILVVVAVIIQLLLQHSNVAYFSGPFKYLLAINQIHRFHHLNTAAEGDVNFGLFTTLTDRLLGTAYYDDEKVIGVEDLGISTAPNYPIDYLAQITEPFKFRQQ